ncbi:hypothetical protein C1646_750730 [Rhizophagus diaphanus]|nr:hypothetical protein C1646_750730 [Rhizophagus diaphanus] [Rhizophagus sp. MUCL 43196]
MAPFTCPYIKRDGTVCGNKCWLPEGCYRHWKLYEKNLKKKPCLFSGCEFPTDADSAPIFELSDVVRPLQPKIYENPVSESDNEDISLGLFGD